MILSKELYSLYSQGRGEALSLRGLRARIAKCETSEQRSAPCVTVGRHNVTGNEHARNRTRTANRRSGAGSPRFQPLAPRIGCYACAVEAAGR